MPPIVIGLLVVAFVFVSVMMMLVVLIQRPTGGGLSGAFGASADGAGQTAFGARTGDALTTATIVIFLLFLGLAVGLNFVVVDSVAPAQAETVEAPADPDAAAGIEEDTDASSTPAATEPSSNDATQEDAPTNGDTPADENPGG